jgi:hypothetical protein
MFGYSSEFTTTVVIFVWLHWRCVGNRRQKNKKDKVKQRCLSLLCCRFEAHVKDEDGTFVLINLRSHFNQRPNKCELCMSHRVLI